MPKPLLPFLCPDFDHHTEPHQLMSFPPVENKAKASSLEVVDRSYPVVLFPMSHLYGEKTRRHPAEDPESLRAKKATVPSVKAIASPADASGLVLPLLPHLALDLCSPPPQSRHLSICGDPTSMTQQMFDVVTRGGGANES